MAERQLVSAAACATALMVFVRGSFAGHRRSQPPVIWTHSFGRREWTRATSRRAWGDPPTRRSMR